MKKYKLIWYFMVSFLIISSAMIILKLRLSNYFPVLFILLFFPFLIYLLINLALISSTYIKKYHFDFYHQCKSMTLGSDGNIVNLLSVSDKEIIELHDQKVLVFKNEMRSVVKLILVCFSSFIFLSILSVVII